MTTFTAADHVTEREGDGTWEDCTFASALEWLRLGLPNGRDIPATVAEKEALRAAAGFPEEHKGASIDDAIKGMERRYGLRPEGYVRTKSWLTLRAALAAGKIAVVQGSMGAVSPWLRRHDKAFTGAHSLNARGWTWCDPLAPKGAYVGEDVAESMWYRYFTALGGEALITTEGGLTRVAGDFVVYTAQARSYKRGKVAPLTPFYNDWGMTDKRGKIGTKGGTLQIFGYRGGVYAVLVNTGQGWDDGKLRPTMVYVPKSSMSGITDTVPPPPPVIDDTPFDQADIDKAAADAAKQENDEWVAWLATHPQP